MGDGKDTTSRQKRSIEILNNNDNISNSIDNNIYNDNYYYYHNKSSNNSNNNSNNKNNNNNNYKSNNYNDNNKITVIVIVIMITIKQNYAKIVWNFSVQADHKLKHSKSDMLIFHTNAGECHKIDVAFP